MNLGCTVSRARQSQLQKGDQIVDQYSRMFLMRVLTIVKQGCIEVNLKEGRRKNLLFFLRPSSKFKRMLGMIWANSIWDFSCWTLVSAYSLSTKQFKMKLQKSITQRRQNRGKSFKVDCAEREWGAEEERPLIKNNREPRTEPWETLELGKKERDGGLLKKSARSVREVGGQVWGVIFGWRNILEKSLVYQEKVKKPMLITNSTNGERLRVVCS